MSYFYSLLRNHDFIWNIAKNWQLFDIFFTERLVFFLDVLEFFEEILEFFGISLEFFGISPEFWCFGKDL